MSQPNSSQWETLLTAAPETPRPELSSSEFEPEREKMIQQQIVNRGINDQRVIDAMRATPRHLFTPKESAAFAYQDTPTISQPYMVAYMSEQLRLTPQARVLEIGAGCGYQTAILSLLAQQVIAIEIVKNLARTASKRLQTLGLKNITLLLGDGSQGYPPGAPYDAILVAAAVPRQIDALTEQLAPSGRLIAPFGPADDVQQLKLIEREANGSLRERDLMSVRFVPLTGDA